MKELPQQCDVVVIGAGAAGLMCAITAAQRGRNVVVLDHANKVGKKILMSGGGRCNFTNLEIQPENYLSHNPHFCKSALSRYTQWDFIALVAKHGIPYHEKTLGQLFCDNKSSDILNMLISEADSSGADIRVLCEINKIEKLESGYSLATSSGSIACASLVVACGGKSIPTMGASGFGYQIAKQFELKLYPTRAGLVPFRLKQPLLAAISEYSGASLDVVVTAKCGQSFKEGMLITHRGLSGPAILQISSYWQEGEFVLIDLLPEVSLHEILCEEHAGHSKLLVHQVIVKFLSKKLAQFFSDFFLSQLGLKTHAIAEYSLADLKKITEQFHGWKVVPENTEGYRTAEVTLGGLDTDELSSKTMEVKKHPNLYFIGEVVDVTGHLGGYNFQWAWSSGYAAGLAV